jgi:drug/metabolite transporter (DMT)-like permease
MQTLQTPRPAALGVALALSAVSIWAGWMVFTRAGLLRTQLQPTDIAALRFFVAGGLLVPVVWRQGLALDRLGWRGLAIMVAGAGVPYALVCSQGLLFAPARHAGALIPGTMPLFAALLAAWALREPVSGVRRVGFASIFCGIVTLVGLDIVLSGHAPPGQWIGHLLFLCAAAMWAAFTVTMKRAGIAPLHATAIVAVCSMVVYLPVYLAFSGVELLHRASPGALAFQALYQGVVSSIVALLFYNKAIAILGASRGAAARRR